ncbi:MAG: hypothetical protein L6R36_007368 [Xanthoria steineri]|nr:MAG: hypothetical protein L6R36_007368 [Xanthoria steineri]
MLIEESHKDVPTKADGDGSMRIFLFHPKIPNYPHARFPAVVLFSEIYQVTGPVARFARHIAGHGYIVAAPSSYHEFTGPEPLAYDGPGTDAGNQYKIQKVCFLLVFFWGFRFGIGGFYWVGRRRDCLFTEWGFFRGREGLGV